MSFPWTSCIWFEWSMSCVHTHCSTLIISRESQFKRISSLQCALVDLVQNVLLKIRFLNPACYSSFSNWMLSFSSTGNFLRVEVGGTFDSNTQSADAVPPWAERQVPSRKNTSTGNSRPVSSIPMRITIVEMSDLGGFSTSEKKCGSVPRGGTEVVAWRSSRKRRCGERYSPCSPGISCGRLGKIHKTNERTRSTFIETMSWVPIVHETFVCECSVHSTLPRVHWTTFTALGR